jgi:hypothetical protein
MSNGNQPLLFNLSHTMLIQRGAQRRWEEWFAKSSLQITHPTSHEFCKSPLTPSVSSPLDQDRVTQIEVCIVCMKRSVSTRYVPFIIIIFFIRSKRPNYTHLFSAKATIHTGARALSFPLSLVGERRQGDPGRSRAPPCIVLILSCVTSGHLRSDHKNSGGRVTYMRPTVEPCSLAGRFLQQDRLIVIILRTQRLFRNPLKNHVCFLIRYK